MQYFLKRENRSIASQPIEYAEVGGLSVTVPQDQDSKLIGENRSSIIRTKKDRAGYSRKPDDRITDLTIFLAQILEDSRRARSIHHSWTLSSA